MSKPKPSRSNNAVSLTNGTTISRLFFLFSQLPRLVYALPVFNRAHHESILHNDIVNASENMTPEQFYINLAVSAVLVLLGGVFAGLTLGLMGQDEVYLKVISTSGDAYERRYARKVLKLIGRGKHWVLVTLLLSNVITNETLPIVLDRCLGGGWPAVVTSTASIVIFGEIIPQSICVRYGLQVGAMFAPFVLILMYIMYPVAYPCALLLDHILGEDHGTVYKKSGLKTLVTLHKTMGVERLNQDEVTIISAVLDLKEKDVANIMTPIDRVFTMSSDMILDEKTVEEIFNAGFSRIPIHLPNDPMNFVGMLLVRVLISYDPEDALPVAAFPLATLPETSSETSCLNILNYFQEGKSHMIIVSETPGEPTGAIGVLTLEDVIEELIGEEIVDESDVYVDINKNIKRTQPGPLSKRHLTSYLLNLYQRSNSNSKRNSLDDSARQPLKEATPDESQVSGSKTWKPMNPAANPLETNKKFVTIKRPDYDTVKSLSGVSRSHRERQDGAQRQRHLVPQYGAVHATEEGALRDAKRRSSDHDSASRQRFLLPEERETDVSEIVSHNGQHDAVDAPPTTVKLDDVNGSGGNSIPLVTQEHSESRSYRTGGIVESVVNVDGVHKTIIENVSDDEDNNELIATPHGSMRKKHLDAIFKNGDGRSEEVEQLLGDDNSSETSKSRKQLMWDRFINPSSDE